MARARNVQIGFVLFLAAHIALAAWMGFGPATPWVYATGFPLAIIGLVYLRGGDEL